MIKMIGLDLDGTTLNENGKLSEFTRKAFKLAREKGAHIVVTTGRTFDSLPEEILSLEGLEYIITSNGAHITRLQDKKVIYSNCIHPDSIEELVKIFKAEGYSIEAFTGGKAYMEKAEYEFFKNAKESYRSIDYILRTRNPVEYLFDFVLDRKAEIENINLNFEDLKDKERALPVISRVKDITITSSFVHNWEIGGATTSKGRALSALADMLEIDPKEELLACGDSPNDISMISLAKVGVCVENGTQETKDAADYVYPSNKDDGVAKAIIDFVINI
ncbi:MAG: Cof-type HAD-IIB family hydrolase [Clostridia bacterium]|nr:Cof-type HAD-IIB family hydrolase [Clostridia bacterium]